MQMTSLLIAESKEELKSLLINLKEESETASLRLNIIKKKKKRSWHSAPLLHSKRGENVEVVTDFLFLGSKITADGDCSQEIRKQLLLGREAMTKLHSVLKSRDITLPTKICTVKAMVFPVVKYDRETWTIKKAEHQELMPSNCGAAEDS